MSEANGVLTGGVLLTTILCIRKRTAMEAALLHVVRAFVLALLSVGFLDEVGTEQIVSAGLDAGIPVTLGEALELHDVVL